MRHFLTIYLAISLVACSIKKNTGKSFINHVSLEKIQDDYFVKNSGILFTGKALKFYENGQIEFEANYLNGELHGLKKSWHKNGEKWQVGEYVKNKKEGKKANLFSILVLLPLAQETLFCPKKRLFCPKISKKKCLNCDKYLYCDRIAYVRV